MTRLEKEREPLLATPAARRRYMENRQSLFQVRVQDLARQYSQGKLDAGGWAQAMKREVKLLHVSQAVAARQGDFGGMTKSDWGKVGAEVKKQYRYLKNFESDMAKRAEEGKDPAPILEARGKLYAGAGRKTFSRFDEPAGAQAVRWSLGIAEHCPDCVELASQSWISAGELHQYPGDGQTQCFLYGHKVKVFTADGWMRLDKVVPGMLVLTHTGRFQSVIETHKFHRFNIDAVRIAVQLADDFGNADRIRTQSVFHTTVDHKFLTASGWKYAGTLEPGDSILGMGRDCANPECDRLVPLTRYEARYCSQLCKNQFDVHVEEAHEVVRHLVKEGKASLQQWHRENDSKPLQEKYSPEALAGIRAGWKRRSEQWMGKTYEERWGPEKAAHATMLIEERVWGRRRGKIRPTHWKSNRGLTLEEMHGKEKAEEIREKLQEYGRRLREERIGKTFEDRYGVELANVIKQKLSVATKAQWQNDDGSLRRAIIEGTKRTTSGFPNGKRTKIEIKMAMMLGSLGINYQEQYYLDNIGFADFYLPEYRLVVECDGDYWHKYPDGLSIDRERDLAVKQSLGLDTIRFWESDIRWRPDWCKEKVGRLLANHAGLYGQGTVRVIDIARYVLPEATLFDLGVAIDHSYVVTKGIISHNCMGNCKCHLEWQ